MSSQETPPPGAGGAPTEEELRAAYEAELARIHVTDLIAQTTVSLLNLAARRLGPPAGADAGPGGDGRDLEQARDAIDGVRALLEILERRMPGEVQPLREALSQLQMAYAREAGPAAAGDPGSGDAGTGTGGAGGGEGSGGQGGGGAGAPGGPGGAPGGAPAPGDGPAQDRGPGPAESTGRLWVPGR